MLFGTKRLRGLGTDLGGAISGFRKSMNGGETAAPNETIKHELK
jgi:sec-independent protein translocase protein TatA